MSELPPSWAIAELDELNDPARPICYGILKPGPDLPDGVPYVKVKNIRNEQVNIEGLHRTSLEIDDQYRRSRLQAGDLLVSIRGTYGRVAPVTAELSGANITQDSARIAPVGVRADYLQKYLQSPHAQSFFGEVARGVAVKGVNIRDLRRTPVHVPPLPEQERIVGAIEEAFSKLDAGEVGLRNVRQLLKRTREAVLAAAVTGRVVPQDPTETPAAKILADLGVEEANRGSYEVPPAWCWAELGALLREPLRNGMSAPAADPASGLPTFTLTAVTTGDFSAKNIKHTAGDWKRASGLWAELGDVFVQRSNTPELVGTARLYRGEPRAAIFPDLLIRVRTVPQVRPAWVEAFMASVVCRRFLRSQAKGLAGSMPKISQPVLNSLGIPVPPEAEQDRILAELDRQMSFIRACERSVDAGLATSAALRRSVLKGAFEGRLVPQDPTDEPASVLLERIRAERAAAPKLTKRRKKATA